MFYLQATDPDAGLNGQVVYELVDNTVSSAFGLNTSSGNIYTFLEFFRTSNNVNLNPYQLRVRASDRASDIERQSTETTVYVSCYTTYKLYNLQVIQNNVVVLKAVKRNAPFRLFHYSHYVQG